MQVFYCILFQAKFKLLQSKKRQMSDFWSLFLLLLTPVNLFTRFSSVSYNSGKKRKKNNTTERRT